VNRRFTTSNKRWSGTRWTRHDPFTAAGSWRVL
jgi:hypothetical protein